MSGNKEGKGQSDLGVIIKSLLREHSLSMHNLSTLSGINTATISRIVSGKQAATVNHLQKFARHLHVPVGQLLTAAGYDLGISGQEPDPYTYTFVDTIQEILKSANLFDQKHTTTLIEKELCKYEQYAQTEEGQRIIHEDFHTKVRQVSGVGPFIDQLNQMHNQFCTEGTTANEQAILGSALLYFILSADIIPDYIFPIGYLDDAVAVRLALNRLAQMKNIEPPAV